MTYKENHTIDSVKNKNSFTSINGRYGEFGGRYVPSVLEDKLSHLRDQFLHYRNDPAFINEFHSILTHYTGRPSPLYYARRLSEAVQSKIYLKREDLNHTGSHKINNSLGQILLAKRMGAKSIIAETGAGQHGVAAATAAAYMGLPCKVFMGEKDALRQAMNVRKMELLGAEVITTNAGRGTLKDAVDAALGYYIEHPDTYYLLGSQVGPDPYPEMVGFFQKVIGVEARQQILSQEGRLPDSIFACIGGGSNAIGLFSAFLNDTDVEIHAAEGGGLGPIPMETAATLTMGRPMIFQGSYSYTLCDDNGAVLPTRSIAAGLDYPGVSPQHSMLKESGRAKYHLVTDTEAIDAFNQLSRLEGIIPAIESAHAVALAMKVLKNQPGKISIINLSGRGDKDVGREL